MAEDRTEDLRGRMKKTLASINAENDEMLKEIRHDLGYRTEGFVLDPLPDQPMLMLSIIMAPSSPYLPYFAYRRLIGPEDILDSTAMLITTRVMLREAYRTISKYLKDGILREFVIPDGHPISRRLMRTYWRYFTEANKAYLSAWKQRRDAYFTGIPWIGPRPPWVHLSRGGMN